MVTSLSCWRIRGTRREPLTTDKQSILSSYTIWLQHLITGLWSIIPVGHQQIVISPLLSLNIFNLFELHVLMYAPRCRLLGVQYTKGSTNSVPYNWVENISLRLTGSECWLLRSCSFEDTIKCYHKSTFQWLVTPGTNSTNVKTIIQIMHRWRFCV